MLESFTPGALRALRRAEARASKRGVALVEPADLLVALADEPESRAAELLDRFGLPADRLFATLGVEPWPDSEPLPDAEAPASVPYSADLRMVLSEIAGQVRASDRNRELNTEDLLAGLLTTPGPAIDRLCAAGLARPQLLAQVTRRE